MFSILEGEDAEQALEETEMVLVDNVTNNSNEAHGAGGSSTVKDNTQVTIEADVVIVCDDGLSDMISGIEEMEE